MKYKYTGDLKLFKGSIRKFKKHNNLLWKKRALFKLKPGDIAGYHGDWLNHKIESIFVKYVLNYCDNRIVPSLQIKFEDMDYLTDHISVFPALSAEEILATHIKWANNTISSAENDEEVNCAKDRLVNYKNGKYDWDDKGVSFK